MAPAPVTASMTMVCTHGGSGRPGDTFPRVRLSGVPVVRLGAPAVVTGCPNPPPPTGTGPCQTAQFPAGSARVRAGNLPLVLQQVPGICVPTGVSLTVVPAGPSRVQVM